SANDCITRFRVNLTDAQITLWGLLVDQHHANAGALFVLVRSLTDAAICYPGEVSVPCSHQDADFLQLNREKLLTLFRDSEGRLCGVPTRLEIAAVLGARSVQAAEDPWKSNPFPEGTRAYEDHSKSMRWAKEHLALFLDEMLQKLPPENASSRAVLDYHLQGIAGKFDIWDKHFCNASHLPMSRLMHS